jgi:SET and MYND domain-containing protein 4
LSKLPFEKRAKLEKDAQVMIKLLQREEELLQKQNKQKPIAPKTKVQEKDEKMFISPNLMYGYNEEEGRFAVAKSKISVAEPIIVEKPHCSVLLESFNKSHCDSCFKRLLSTIFLG